MHFSVLTPTHIEHVIMYTAYMVMLILVVVKYIVHISVYVYGTGKLDRHERKNVVTGNRFGIKSGLYRGVFVLYSVEFSNVCIEIQTAYTDGRINKN